MTALSGKSIKDILLKPYIELKCEYYDLGLPNRDKLKDRVTTEAALAIKKYGVGVKCATIPPMRQGWRNISLKHVEKPPMALSVPFWTARYFASP